MTHKERKELEHVSKRFWQKVDRRGKDECWPWIGEKGAWDVKFRISRTKALTPHRLAYLFTHPEFDRSERVRHTCGTALCCNPNHMHLGPKPDKDRFWRNVDVKNKSECWPWTSALFPNGYGCFHSLSGRKWKMTTAHRVAWILTNGEIPKGFNACHRCDNPKCCNPSHIFIGSQKQNCEDMAQKGRSTHGEKHPNHKLTASQVRDIRESYAKGGITQKQLSEEFSINNIGLIVRHKIWTRV